MIPEKCSSKKIDFFLSHCEWFQSEVMVFFAAYSFPKNDGEPDVNNCMEMKMLNIGEIVHGTKYVAIFN